MTAQIRIGILPLHIETGRSRNVKVEERVCRVCKNGDVENEFHFVCTCNAYTTLRNMMYDTINDVTFYNMTDRDKFVYLMQKHGSNWVNILKQLGIIETVFYINKRNWLWCYLHIYYCNVVSSGW